MSLRSRAAWLLLLPAIVTCSQERPIDGPGDGGVPPGSTSDADMKLAGGDVRGAFIGYGQTTGATAAAGACLTRTLLLIEQAPVTAALARFGQGPGKVDDLAGPHSLLSRAAAEWTGSGMITAGAPLAASYTFTRGKDANAYFTASNYRADTRLGVSHPSAAIVTGLIEHATFDCATGARSSPTPTLSLSFSSADFSCYQPTTVPSGPGCTTDGGSIEVLSAPSGVGSPLELRFSNLLVTCNCRAVGCSVTDQRVRLAGTVSGRSSTGIDTNGLHPLMADVFGGGFEASPYINALTPGTTVDQIFRDLLPIRAEIEAAAAECARAGQGSGVVFTVPGSLFGGDDLPVTAADAKLLAALLHGASFALHVASAYVLPLDLAALCTGTTCAQDADLVARLNAAVPTLSTPAAFSLARPQLESTLSLAIAASDGFGADSLIPRNTQTTAGLDHFKSWSMTLQSSVGSGQQRLAEIAPVVRIDLMSFFAQPPDPAATSADPFVFETQIKLVETFFHELIGPVVDVRYDGSQAYSGPPDATEVTQALADTLSRHGMVLP